MKFWRIPFMVLIAVHVAILFAGFFAPYEPAAQSRDFSFAPPTKLHWRDSSGELHFRPFVYGFSANADGDTYSEDRNLQYPLHFFVPSKSGNGAPSRLHLFAVEQPGHIFLLGTDEY